MGLLFAVAGKKPDPQPTGAAVVTPAETETPPPVVAETPVETPVQAPPAVVLGTDLPGATVAILDATGKKLAAGPAPFTAPTLPAGRYFVKVEKPGFVAAKVAWDGGAAPTVALTQFGGFELALSPVPAVVKVDGKPQRATATPFRYQLPPGKHKLLVTAGGYLTKNLEVEVEAGKNVTLPEVTLEKAVATLVIRTNRSGARVFLDGQEKGQTAKKGGEPVLTLTDLPPGAHDLKVTLDGYETYRKKISLEGGKEKKEQATLVVLPPPPPVYVPPPPRYDPPPPRYDPPPPYVPPAPPTFPTM